MAAPDDKTQKIFEELKKCAWNMRTVAYKELADKAGILPIAIGPHLGYIRDTICRQHGRPWLNAIAVSGVTWRPGDGFLPGGISIGQKDDEVLWRGVVLQVFAYEWSDVNLEM